MTPVVSDGRRVPPLPESTRHLSVTVVRVTARLREAEAEREALRAALNAALTTLRDITSLCPTCTRRLEVQGRLARGSTTQTAAAYAARMADLAAAFRVLARQEVA